MEIWRGFDLNRMLWPEVTFVRKPGSEPPTWTVRRGGPFQGLWQMVSEVTPEHTFIALIDQDKHANEWDWQKIICDMIVEVGAATLGVISQAPISKWSSNRKQGHNGNLWRLSVAAFKGGLKRSVVQGLGVGGNTLGSYPGKNKENAKKNSINSAKCYLFIWLGVCVCCLHISVLFCDLEWFR